MSKEKCSIDKPRFFMDISFKLYHKVNQTNKGAIYLKIYHQNIRGLGKKAGELLSHLHQDVSHCLMPDRTSFKVFTIEKCSYWKV